MGKNNISFKIEPSIIDKHLIKLETTINDIRETFYSRLIDAEDQAVRDALIKLGWTPPTTCPICKGYRLIKNGDSVDDCPDCKPS